MISHMRSEAWLNQNHQFAVGAEIFRSNRSFGLWAFSVSHSQLLLRARGTDDGSRIDVLFKPVEAMKVRADYDGLVIRCASTDERERILRDLDCSGAHLRVLMLETAGRLDYVVAAAVGWREEQAGDRDPSTLASFPPAGDPERILPIGSPYPLVTESPRATKRINRTL
jgi:hypothetical protein